MENIRNKCKILNWPNFIVIVFLLYKKGDFQEIQLEQIIILIIIVSRKLSANHIWALRAPSAYRKASFWHHLEIPYLHKFLNEKGYFDSIAF